MQQKNLSSCSVRTWWLTRSELNWFSRFSKHLWPSVPLLRQRPRFKSFSFPCFEKGTFLALCSTVRNSCCWGLKIVRQKCRCRMKWACWHLTRHRSIFYLRLWWAETLEGVIRTSPKTRLISHRHSFQFSLCTRPGMISWSSICPIHFALSYSLTWGSILQWHRFTYCCSDQTTSWQCAMKEHYFKQRLPCIDQL